MFDTAWFTSTPTALLMIVLTTAAFYGVLIVFIRLSGLRSFSKMSSFDFATTVAMGSLLASVIVAEDPPLLQGIVALGMLFMLQFVVAFSRSRSEWACNFFDNSPLLLMAGSEVLYDHLKQARITEDDLRAKLREANVLDLRQVRAVVLEATGDVSVLHGAADGPSLNPDLLSDVRGADRLKPA
ncbi:MAG: DUF421 domain-containing protein [Rhodothermales bacterium]